jgi:hypothetical protein
VTELQWDDSKLFCWNEYHDFIIKTFFNICKDKNVLEIAPMTGNQTQAIVKCLPKSLLLVEAWKDYYSKLANDYPSATIIMDDIFKVFQNKISVDVVIACGLLYHLHNSFQLLELIANQSDPEYIILDCVEPHNDVVITTEILNVQGNRVEDKDRKCINYNIIVSFKYIDMALNDLGYTCIEKANMGQFDISCKQYSWMAMWKKLYKES